MMLQKLTKWYALCMKVIRTQAEEVISLHGLVLNGSQVSHLEMNKLLKHLKMFLIL